MCRTKRDFLKIKERASIVPFQAIWECFQILSTDCRKLLRGSDLAVAIRMSSAALVRNTAKQGTTENITVRSR